ncbi:MAG: hypothetical protein CFE24_13260 [Flavobacterium sp. BFFFF2]|nr:MAG: hypothetical protein CFE24_13260 [Flavobacterium sp. BFFFF2]
MIILVATTTLTFAQKKFVQGYIIDMNNVKTMAEIQDQDWENLPDNIKFKTSGGLVKKIAVDSLRGFSVDQVCKFNRQMLDLDVEYTGDYTLSSLQPNPDFQKSDIWIKTLIEGKISLYEFNASKKPYFYYSIDGGTTILPLIYRPYQVSNTLNENNQFRRDLARTMGITEGSNSIFTCPYKEEKLIDLVVKYNAQFDPGKQITYKEKINFRRINGNLKMGLANSTFSMENVPDLIPDSNNSFTRNTSVSSKFVKFRPSFELELNYSTKYKKWSVLLETALLDYSSSNPVEDLNIEVNYNAVNAIIGLKRYFTVFNKNVYLQAGISYEVFSLNREYKLNFMNKTVYKNDLPSRGVGICSSIGINITSKIFFEFRYDFRKSIFIVNRDRLFNDQVSAAIFSVGYTVF